VLLDVRVGQLRFAFVKGMIGDSAPCLRRIVGAPVCQDCKKLFSKILSIVDYEKGRVGCPKCGSKNVEQRWSAFIVITSNKSA
jgi:RNA polymerase subunit RPABC4/transcription elongation factor Spt4